jgi:hypothetical protein
LREDFSVRAEARLRKYFPKLLREVRPGQKWLRSVQLRVFPIERHHTLKRASKARLHSPRPHAKECAQLAA